MHILCALMKGNSEYADRSCTRNLVLTDSTSTVSFLFIFFPHWASDYFHCCNLCYVPPRLSSLLLHFRQLHNVNGLQQPNLCSVVENGVSVGLLKHGLSECFANQLNFLNSIKHFVAQKLQPAVVT